MGMSIFDYEIIFRTEDDHHLEDIARSLLASDALIQIAAEILEGSIPGLQITRTRVRFGSLSTNSPLTEKLSIEVLHSFQQELTKAIPDLVENLVGAQIDAKYHGLFSSFVILVVLYGLNAAARKVLSKKEKIDTDSAIQTNYHHCLIVNGDILGVPAEDLQRLLETRFNQTQTAVVAKKALDFIAPVRFSRGGSIHGGSSSISAESLRQVPSDMDLSAVDNNSFVPYERRRVVIHATDIDHAKSGWAGHLPGLWDRRLKMQLFPGIDQRSLFGRQEIVADIVLVSKRNGGALKPHLFHVLKIHEL